MSASGPPNLRQEMGQGERKRNGKGSEGEEKRKKGEEKDGGMKPPTAKS